MQGSGRMSSFFPHLRLLGATALVGAILAGGAFAADAPKAPAAKPASSCVACHTDAEKLKTEAAKVPVPAGSALQAGKG